MNVPDNLLYRESHEWLDAAQSPAVCGITDHAQHEITDVSYVELPQLGRKVTAGEAICTVESVKAANDIYAPVSGEVVGVNEALLNDPSLVNTDPYGIGWLFKIQRSGEGEEASMLSPEAYRSLIA
jgi:glycine cleavage system H protein